jgi:23S rRNA pseudouridine955/2504/2580 synthase
LQSQSSKFSSATNAGVQHVVITEKNAGQRLDNFLLGQMRQVPKSKIYNIIRKGEVRVNCKRCRPDQRLLIDDEVRIPPVAGVTIEKRTLPLSASLQSYLDSAVLYQDADVFVINKPAGLAVHGGSGVSAGLIEAMRQKQGAHVFLELVHRLDRDTSGCILLARNRTALRFLHAQFREDRVHKFYHLLVHGKWSRRQTHVDAPLRKNALPSGERMVVVAQDGKRSRTDFRILAQNSRFSLLEARPITGRTHQIRVHAAFAGHAIVGDPKYLPRIPLSGPELPSRRLMLHAYRIELTLPSGKPLAVECPYDESFRENLQVLELLS